MQIRAFDSDSHNQDGAETPRGYESRGNVSNLKLVFAEPQRGLPSLRRGWRTPDPSPDRTGLPKCAPYAEYLEETEEALDVGRGRPTDVQATLRLQTPSPPRLQAVPDFRMDSYMKHVAQAFRASWADQSEETDEEEALEAHVRGRPMEAHAAVRLQTPSPQPLAVPDFRMDSYVQHVTQAFCESWADQSAETAETESPADSEKTLQYPLCASFGSRGHPFSCNPACKYAAKGKGCKDGADCDHCHLCTWKKSVAQRNTRRAGRPRKPRQSRGQ
ncbi:unnamed protein product [Symbiodinium sp. CCMP2456]|nr:unnamed protein product [Symbiodinium sp. CCMP2456]